VREPRSGYLRFEEQTMSQPKVVVVGAGSYFFGRPAIWAMMTSEILRGGTLALVDTNPEVLATMLALAERVKAELGAPTTIIGSTDRREVLRDADFVVLTFSDRGVYFRGLDVEIAAKHGVRMCSADTIGSGGIFRALREIPTALAITRDVEELAPYAWVINFVNPSTVIGMALARYANVRSFAICDGLHEPFARLNFLKTVGLMPQDAIAIPPAVEARLDLRIVGVNHFTWVTKFTYNGEDYLPRWREKLAEWASDEVAQNAQLGKGGNASDNNANSKARFNACYTKELTDIFGIAPACIAHTKEYVPYYQGFGVAPVSPEPVALFDAEQRAREVAAHHAETRAYVSGEKPIADFLKKPHWSCISRYPDTPVKIKGDHATDIIESMWGGLGRVFFINTFNRGAVSNMPADAFLEMRCYVDLHGPVPLPLGEMPRGVLGLQHQVLDTHELTAQAAATFDRDLLLRALATDPIINNLTDARAIMEETFERQRDALDARWYAGVGVGVV